MKKARVFIGLLGFFFCLVLPLSADEISELKQKVQAMGEENRLLQEKLKNQESTIQDLATRLEKLEAKESAGPAVEKEIKTTGVIDIPKLKIKGFADLGFSAKFTDNGSNTSFSRRQVDLFITSEITDRVSFLAESVFESDEDTNSQEFELERADLKYSFSDFFNIKIGRMHTPLGYWNQAFHHGTWFQTTIFRPEIYPFEDQGGILPIHSVGMEILGTKPFNTFDLEYNFDILNGRGRTRTTIQNARDENNSKAINALISIKPHLIEGLKFGTDIYHDIIPSNPDDPNRIARINELILGVYFTYIHDKVEILGELFHIAHDDKTSGKDFDTLGYYLQTSYKINKSTPYYRFDFINFGNGDPYFSGVDTDIKKHTLGLRWDILTWNALKFEYSHSDKKNSDNEDSFTINSSFTF